MLKSFVFLRTEQTLVIDSRKTLLVNTSSFGNLNLVPVDQLDAMEQLSDDVKQAVQKAIYAIKPGETKALPSGTYALTFEYNGSAVLVIDEPKAATVPVIPVAPVAPVAPVDKGENPTAPVTPVDNVENTPAQNSPANA